MLSKYQKLPLRGLPSEQLEQWGRNDFLMLTTPNSGVDAIVAARRLDAILARIKAVEGGKRPMRTTLVFNDLGIATVKPYKMKRAY